MNNFNYRQKLDNAKNQTERDKINKQYMNYRRKLHRRDSFKKFCIDNLFNIINSVITLLALVVAILSLTLQLPKQ